MRMTAEDQPPSLRTDRLEADDRRTESAPTRELVVRAQAGDRAAFAALWCEHERVVHGILLAAVGPGDAVDLMQDVGLLALRALAGLKDPASFSGWLAAIARNRAKDHWKRRARTAPIESAAAVRAPESSTDDRSSRALNAVRALPEAYREALILRLVEGLSGPEIARKTGLTPGSVRVNLCRGMKLLRARLEPDWP